VARSRTREDHGMAPSPKAGQGLPSAHIESAGNGYAIIEAARSQELNPVEIDTKFFVLGRDGWALAVEPHTTGGRVDPRSGAALGARAFHDAREIRVDSLSSGPARSTPRRASRPSGPRRPSSARALSGDRRLSGARDRNRRLERCAFRFTHIQRS
jgi:hypothetical protein